MALLLLVAGAIGVLVGEAGGLVAAGVAVGLAALVLFLTRPLYALALLVIVIPVENMLQVGSGASAVRFLGLAVFGSWFLRKLYRGESWSDVIGTSYFRITILFLVLVLASATWANNAISARSGFIQLAQLVALSYVVLDLVRSKADFELLARSLVVGGLMAGGLTLEQGYLAGVARAGADIAGGVNATAIVLVTIIPFGFYLMRSSSSRIWQALGTALVPISGLAIVLSLSRLNLLLILPLLAILGWLTLRGRTGRGWLLLLVVAAGLGASRKVPWERLLERAETIAPYLTGTLAAGSTEGGVSERGYHLRVGLEIARDHPVLGVGYNNYGEHFRSQYQFNVQGRDQFYRSNRSPHSSYIGILADLGIVGLALWVALMVSIAHQLLKAHRIAREPPSRGFLQALQTVIICFALYATIYGFYTPTQKLKMTWVVFGIALALARIVSEGSSMRRENPAPDEAVPETG